MSSVYSKITQQLQDMNIFLVFLPVPLENIIKLHVGMGCVRFTILYAADRARENRPAFVSIRELCMRNFQYARSDPMDLDRAKRPGLRSNIWLLFPSKSSCWHLAVVHRLVDSYCKELSDWFKQ